MRRIFCFKKGWKSILNYQIYLIVLINLISHPIFSKNYYFSSVSGNDAYSSTQAQNKNTPWKTIAKLNSSMSLFNPGDSILFRRGETFYGTIVLSRSGTSTAKIVFGAYGLGSNPVICGLSLLTGWVNSGGNIWKAYCPQLGNSVPNMFVNGEQKQMGRYPNIDVNFGYLTINAHSGNTQLTCNTLNSTKNWVGATAVVRTERWILDPVIVNGQNGSTLSFSTSTSKNIKDGWGFYLTNNINTLDLKGEWYFDPNSKYMYLYMDSDPNNFRIEAPFLKSLFLSQSNTFFEIDNIDFKGSTGTNIDLNNSKNAIVSNCSITLSGTMAISLDNSSDVKIINNNIREANDIGIKSSDGKNIAITKNNIKRIGLINVTKQTTRYTGIFFTSSTSTINNTIMYNSIDSVGYEGIFFYGNNTTIQYNFISNFCLNIDDGGGIYLNSFGNFTINTNYGNRIIKNNIIINGIGNYHGAKDTLRMAEGIYIDDYGEYVQVLNNTIANCSSGIKLHNDKFIQVRNNTIFNNEKQILFQHDSNHPNHNFAKCIITDNIVYSKQKNQLNFIFYCNKEDLTNFEKIDSNYYGAPKDKYLYYYLFNSNSAYLSLKNWQDLYKYDLHSFEKILANPVPDNFIKFLYNPSESIKTYQLSDNYVDPKGNRFEGKIELSPYSSALLFVDTSQINNQAEILDFGFKNINYSKIIDTTNHVITITLVAGASVSNLTASFILSFGANAKVNNVLQVSEVTPNDFSSPVIYSVTSKNGQITKKWTVKINFTNKTLTITGIKVQDKEYDGNTIATLNGGKLEGIIGSDQVSFITGSGNFLDKKVGDFKTVIASGYKLTGANADNYVLTQPFLPNANITPKTLTFNVTAHDKLFDDNDTVNLEIGSLIGVIQPDDVSLKIGKGRFIEYSIGSDKEIVLSDFSLTGIDAKNYSLKIPTGLTASILINTNDIQNPISIFNVFTPNEDGINDMWHIDKIEQYPNNEVFVFDRQGLLVYKASNYQNDWNGGYLGHGEILPKGNYYYIINLIDLNIKYKGSVAIIR